MNEQNLLKQYRVLNKMTQRDVAEKLNMTHSGYSKYERGERKISLDLWMNLTIILNIPVTEFSTHNIYIGKKNLLDYKKELRDLARQILQSQDKMTQFEIDSASSLFRLTYDKIEKEKAMLLRLLKPDRFEDIIKAYKLEHLYK